MRFREYIYAWRSSALQVLRNIDDSLMPERCAFCGTRTLRDEPAACGGCREDLPWLDNPRQDAPAPLTALVAIFAYEFPVDAALKALKFKRKLYYAPAFGSMLGDALRFLPDDIDALLPVPLHWRRLTVRGFNQALEISKPLARRYGLPIVNGVVRHRATRSQSGLTAAERNRNLQGAFTVRRTLSARHVLIVDDVVTTAATTRHVARVLLKSGVEKVSVLAVARAV